MAIQGRSILGCTGGVCLLYVLALTAPGWASHAAPPDFEHQIAPLLVKRCVECHQERDPSGGLALVTRAGLLKGGGDGPAVVPGAPDASHIFARVLAGEMPPEEKGLSRKLPEAEIALLREWIQSGAPWPEGRKLDLYEATTEVRGGRDWWSFQPIKPVAPPNVTHPELASNPIDAFILAGLEKAGMEPAPLADRRNLIRRVYYDVIGLPPSFEQIKAFVADDRPDAWERVVDGLLANPHYGEKWARHWLDVVRFAETSGYERDQEKPYAWRYRDWVVDAINDDLPYDQFVVQQLAGDEVPDRTERTVIATGMLRLGTWNDEPNDAQDYKYERLEDLVHVTSSAFLGLTVKCARCHDHKFDPIPQTDYYRLAAAFWPGAIEARDGKYVGGPTPEELGYENVLGWSDITNTPQPIHLLKNGERDKPGVAVEAGVLTVVPALDRPFDMPPANAKSTFRRLQLARWITNPANPLTPRVAVNRLWQHHFGKGLVRTPDNFGYKGDLPTHPELLDWLANELIQGGWKMKPLHRMILLSRTYRQATVHPQQDAYNLTDASNMHWWRAERRRLDAEALRDTMLSVTGELDETRGGPSFKPAIAADALEGLSTKDAAWKASPEGQQHRRSLYIYSKRSLLPPMMTTFNFTDTTLPCAQRDSTIAPTQALALLNNAFTHERSAALARRVISTAGATPEERIGLAWRYALERDPTLDEARLSLEHLVDQQARFAKAGLDVPDQRALESLCHVLLNGNEFIYVD
ncbi:MAG: PSD1 domain-containing protein [Candidatus Hydrogenedentes bacterium]|nr:PSD1 domain-containing protein [Candidatus Hydrogenedentota bacterium]